ncbi:MAG: RagB/SusD family nutrient uptake outer membrane protein [Bacteroidales bacterium]|nr:RagB/SusD family nutrient uptake outer membrane protein [Bacteroidales bacterium]
MKIFKYQLLAIIILICFAGCEVLEPEDDNVYDIEDLNSVMTYTEGLLMNAYRSLPTSHSTFPLAYASDEAVNNDPSSSIKAVVSGGWTSNSNPFSVWNSSYESIFYINTFLTEMEGVKWYWENEVSDSLFAVKLRAEALALRAWNYFNLLQAHAGRGTDGEMLGVPIIDTILEINSPVDYEIQRASFNDLVAFIVADCDTAIKYLPTRWSDTDNPERDRAMGARNTNRINGLTARFIKAKTLLYAASPAYSDGTYTYTTAIMPAAFVLVLNGLLTSVTPANSALLDFYNNPVVADHTLNNREVIWYSSKQNPSQSWEQQNYPPSLSGRGYTNPTQDLVNAFPMLDGTPVTEDKLNSSNPYSGRDPRLAKYIIYNGSSFKVGGVTTTFNTKPNSTSENVDAVGSSNDYSTKTGYYLRKFMNTDNVNLDPKVNSSGMHYYTYVRYTEALLMFAEAANEAGGPDALYGGMSARSVMNALRSRVGITSNAYVNGLADKYAMRDFIRNERRIELCFEEQRFWDLRRWNMIDEMKKPVNGVQVSEDGTTYTYFEVEKRDFLDYQIYGPIPYSETIKYPIIQNAGW